MKPLLTSEPLDPIVSPLSVNVNAEAPIVAPDVVMTTDVAVVAPHVAVSPATLLAPAATAGVTDGAKKPEGYVSVMVPPTPTDPPTVVVNEKVAEAPVLPATRSDAAISKEGLVTRPPILPELAPEDGVGSALVATMMPVASPAVAAPMVRLLTVTVTAVPAAIA